MAQQLQLLKLVASHIKVGAPLPFNVRDEHGHLLLAAGQVIHGDAQLQALLSRGIHADVEEIKALAAGRKVEPQPPTLFARWTRSFWNLDALSRMPPVSADFLPALEELGNNLQALVRQEPDVAIYQMLRQEPHHLRMYGLTHTVFAAALCLLISTRLQWSEAAQRSLLMAALTMNLSVLELQARYAVYGRLTADLRDELQRHPDDAVARLRSAGVQDEDWLRTVAEHHEHVDGQGYPRGLTAVSEPAQLLRLVDVFLAKISRREGRPAIDVREAERHAYGEWPGSQLVAALVKEIGIYPPGELVCLASGERAVVARRGASMQTPLAMALTDKRGIPTHQAMRRDCAQREFAITGIEPDKALVARLPMERVYGLLT